MFALLSLVLPLGLLIWLVFRGWPILLVAPVMALFAALLAADPIMATLTQRFTPAMGGFVVAFLPLFLLGALFGKLMEATGAASALAEFIIARLGTAQAIPAVVMSCALLTYGGVSLFVVAFAVYPLAIALFRRAELPQRLIPAAIALGSFTFTMSALPGSPSIQNAIPMPYFGTTTFAAPGLGLVAGIIMAAGGLIYLAVAARAHGPAIYVSEAAITARPQLPVWVAFAPILMVFAANLVLAQVIFPRMNFGFLAREEWGGIAPESVIGVWALIGALTLAILLLMALTARDVTALKVTLAQGAEAALMPLFNTAMLVGFGAVVAGLPAFGIVNGLISDMPGGVLVSVAASASLLAGLTGSASGGMSIALDALGDGYLLAAEAEGVAPAALHRIVALATGGLDALPHNGAVVTLLGISGLTHKEAYGPIFVVAVLIPVGALLVTLLAAATFGTF